MLAALMMVVIPPKHVAVFEFKKKSVFFGTGKREFAVCTFVSMASQSEELQFWGCSKILLSLLMRFDGHF